MEWKTGTVGSYTSNPHGPVNTWWIETGEGLIVVDAQRALHEARIAAEAIKATGRPVLAILITHCHTDHIGGLPVFREVFGQGTPIYADATTIEHLKDDPMNDIGFTKLFLGPDFPDEMVIPDRVVEDGDSLRFGEITINVRVLGYCEAPSMTMYYVPEADLLFSGDLLTNMHTPWLVEGHTGEWLRMLGEMKTAYPDTVTIHPGHGEKGTTALFDDDATYIRAFRETVAAYGDGVSILDQAAIADLVATMSKKYPPDYSCRPAVADLSNLMVLNVVGVAREMGRLPKSDNLFELS